MGREANQSVEPGQPGDKLCAAGAVRRHHGDRKEVPVVIDVTPLSLSIETQVCASLNWVNERKYRYPDEAFCAKSSTAEEQPAVRAHPGFY